MQENAGEAEARGEVGRYGAFSLVTESNNVSNSNSNIDSSTNNSSNIRGRQRMEEKERSIRHNTWYRRSILLYYCTLRVSLRYQAFTKKQKGPLTKNAVAGDNSLQKRTVLHDRIPGYARIRRRLKLSQDGRSRSDIIPDKIHGPHTNIACGLGVRNKEQRETQQKERKLQPEPYNPNPENACTDIKKTGRARTIPVLRGVRDKRFYSSFTRGPR